MANGRPFGDCVFDDDRSAVTHVESVECGRGEGEQRGETRYVDATAIAGRRYCSSGWEEPLKSSASEGWSHKG